VCSYVLQRVSFRFGSETEVRYLTRAPEVGDRVTRATESWLVSEVDTDELGALVTCGRSPPSDAVTVGEP
jgi:hypothetical protein